MLTEQTPVNQALWEPAVRQPQGLQSIGLIQSTPTAIHLPIPTMPAQAQEVPPAFQPQAAAVCQEEHTEPAHRLTALRQ